MRITPALMLIATFAADIVLATVPPPISDDLRGLNEFGINPDAPASAWAAATATNSDLLRRLVTQFRVEVPAEPWIEQELNWYLRHPDYLDRVFNRGQPYIYYIIGELEKRSMPVELALLPIVESAFDPFAYSHGRAAGLWQIIPGTGRRFGLAQNWWYDGRRDVVAATRAALDYLELLAREFDGDWLLAVAAYNSGEGNVRKAIRRNRSRGEPIDFFSLRAQLPRETRAYVPRFLALVKLVGNAPSLGVTLPRIEDTPTIAIADTGGQIDLALAAELAGIPLETLYRLNPGFNRWATSPDGPHQLVVPLDAVQTFREALAKLPDSQRLRWLRHKIAEGETLSQIAERYSTSVKSLRQANNLRGNTIRAGRHLLVPASREPIAAYTLTAEARLRTTQSRQRDGQQVKHTVRRGESLWTIAQRYGVGVQALARWNAMAPRDTLSAGREIVVWVDSDVPVASGTETSTPPRGIDETRRIRYTVRNGDNLSVIAARFRVQVSDLLRWNSSLTRDGILRPGQRLTLYVDVARQSS
ncbi:MAG: LysM peptidoglycan-binding domain-containing protein [Pseudomonadota bacterium]